MKCLRQLSKAILLHLFWPPVPFSLVTAVHHGRGPSLSLFKKLLPGQKGQRDRTKHSVSWLLLCRVVASAQFKLPHKQLCKIHFSAQTVHAIVERFYAQHVPARTPPPQTTAGKPSMVPHQPDDHKFHRQNLYLWSSAPSDVLQKKFWWPHLWTCVANSFQHGLPWTPATINETRYQQQVYSAGFPPD